MIFVSGFYDLSKHEPRRTSAEEWNKRAEWLFSQDVPLVYVADVLPLPHERHFETKVFTPQFSFDEDEISRVDALLSRSTFNYDPTKDTARYLLLMKERYRWMRLVSEHFYPGETFTWVDSGLPHAPEDTLLDVAKRDPAPDKIRLASISYVPRYAREDLDVYYGRHWWPVGGGLWSARAPEIEWLVDRIDEEWHRCLDLGFAVTDEMMLGRIVIEHPEKFDLYYANHTSLVANWDGAVRRDHRLIAEMAYRALEDGSPDEARDRFLRLAGMRGTFETHCGRCGRPLGTPGIGNCWSEPACLHKPQERIG